MDDNNPESSASATFHPDQHTASRALDLLELFLEAQVIGDEARAQLAIIVEELVTNIVEHGQSRADQPVTLALERSASEIIVVLSDGGVAFDPCVPVEPGNAPPDRGGGAGLALVQKWAGTMSYERTKERNIVRLTIAVGA